MSITTNLRDDFDRFVAGDEHIDRYELFRRLRHDAPVTWSETVDAWVVSRYHDVKEVLEDEEGFRPLREGAGAPIYGPAMLQWNGREHSRKGGRVAARLRSPRSLTDLETLIESTAISALEAMLVAEQPVDLRSRYSARIPLKVMGEILALEAEDFAELYHDIVAGGVSSIGHEENRRRAFAALDRLREVLTPVLEERRERPGDDVLSDLCQVRYEGEPLQFDEIVAMAAFLLTAGVETTERAMTSLMLYLLSEPERWEAVRQDPDGIPAVCAEGLRMLPPVQGITRRATGPGSIGGQEIAKGDRFLLLLASANRDESVFDDSHHFDFARFRDNPEREFTNAGTIMPFGAGRHHCVGSQIARLELTHGLSTLAARLQSLRHVPTEFDRPDGFLLVSPERLYVEVT